MSFDGDTARRREEARHGSGRFGQQEYTAPEVALMPGSVLSQGLLSATSRERERWDALVSACVSHLNDSMPAAAEIVEYEYSDDGPWLCVFDGYDADGDDLEEGSLDYVDEVLRTLGAPDEDYDAEPLIRPNGEFGWERSSQFDQGVAAAAQQHYERALAEWTEAHNEAQSQALQEIRISLPPSVLFATFGWSEEGPHLTLRSVTHRNGEVELARNSLGVMAQFRRVEEAVGLLRDPDHISDFRFNALATSCRLDIE